MKWLTIPQFIPDWLHRYPLLLAQMLVVTNLVLAPTSSNVHKKILGTAVLLFLGLLLLWAVLLDGRAAFVLETALGYGGVVAAATGLYTLSLVAKLLKKNRTVLARSWLIATPLVRSPSLKIAVVSLAIALFWRISIALTLIFILGIDSSVTLEQLLRLATLAASGGAAGAILAGLFSRRRPRRRSADSRFTPRLRSTIDVLPSSKALSQWPIMQAFAWSRPENSRILLAAVILTVPVGTGFLAFLVILAIWVIGSYLVALQVALPYVGRAASDWLRSTPMSFWQFAWALARQALLQQLCATLLVMVGLMLAGSSLLMPVYFGAVWMTMVVMTAAISLSDCYRSRSPFIKTAVSTVGAVLVEQRAQGWGIALSLVICSIHLAAGARYERA